MVKQWMLLLATLSLICSISAWAEKEVLVKGFFKNSVVLSIDGKQHVLKVGKQTRGVKLIETDGKVAVLEIEGQRKTLSLSKRIGGAYREPAKKAVRISQGVGGHYFVSGRINNRTVNLLVDTGATSIAMNSLVANSLGIDYRRLGTPTRVNTASDTADAFDVNLRSVSVGDITLTNVKAVVIEGAYPVDILLGNSFLSKVNMKVEFGVMILQSKF